jgi:hypothetical protein
MEKFFVIVLMVIGAALVSYYGGQFCSNYGETKREKIKKVIFLVLGIVGVFMFVGGVMVFPLFF